MPVHPRAELTNVARCYHGSIERDEIETLGLKSTIVDFSVNTNPFGPSPLVAEALRKVDVRNYPEKDAISLRRALSSKLGIDVDQIVVGNGSVELIWLVCLAFLRTADATLILAPTFGEYERACRIMGADVHFCVAREIDDFKPDIARILELVDDIGPKLVFLCNPNNPTGYGFSKQEIEGIIDALQEGLVVIDEAYASFSEQPWASEQLIERQNVVLLRSMTKDYALTGLRIGYALADAGIVEAMRRAQPPWSVNAFALAAALASLQDDEHLKMSRRELWQAKHLLVSGLERIGLKVIPSQANFLLVKVGRASDLRRRLLDKGFCVRDCSSFGLDKYIRIGVRTRDECRALLAAIEEVL